jgi:hypothetical protein
MTDDVQRSLGRIEGKLDGLLERLQEHTAEDAVNFKELRESIGTINAKIQFWSGGIALIVSAISVGATELASRLWR